VIKEYTVEPSLYGKQTCMTISLKSLLTYYKTPFYLYLIQKTLITYAVIFVSKSVARINFLVFTTD
jgi:hypothetical protein